MEAYGGGTPEVLSADDMESSRVLTPQRRKLLEEYPLYSQDGKKGDGVALFRLFLTGTPTTFYIMEGEPCGEYDGRENWDLYGVSNLGEADGFRYGYFSLAELEGLNLYDGLLHLEADAGFTPTPLRDIAEVSEALKSLWENIDGQE